MSTHTQHTHTLLASWSADMSITKEEIIDVDALNILVKNDDVSKDDQAKLRAIKRKLVSGRYLESTYKLGKSVKAGDTDLGRLCVLKGIGLQMLPRELRSALAKRNYWDIDIASAQPSLCAQLCERYGIDTTYQKEFLEARDKYLDELGEHLQAERSTVKERINALYFGTVSACNGLPSFFSENLQPEILRARKLIIAHEDWADSLKFLKNKQNREGSSFAYVLQTIERTCLLEMDNSLNRHKRSLDVFIHDGGLVRKTEGETQFPEGLLRAVEDEVRKMTGYSIKLVVKPLDHGYDFDDDDNYQKIKADFETHTAKLMTPACYIDLRTMMFVNTQDLQHRYANKHLDGQLFLSKWKADPHILTYDNIDFLPGLEAPEGVLNLWRGFPCEAKAGDVSVIRGILGLICSHNQEQMDYVENYFAHLFQKPYEKPGVCIVVHSEEEGVGKDTYFDFVGKMLGRYFINTSEPENSVFSRFNYQLAQTLLVKMEEGNFETNKSNQDNLKSLITCELKTYEEKGKPLMTLRSFTRTVMTTNNPVPVVLSDTARRFMMLKASAERRGDKQFWTKVHEILKQPETASAYFDYLSKRDISKFNPRDFPESEYKNEVITALRPHSAVFFQSICESVAQPTIEWRARELFNTLREDERTKYPLNEHRFGREMRKYMPTMTKTERNDGSRYGFVIEDMVAFLKQKNWWVVL